MKNFLMAVALSCVTVGAYAQENAADAATLLYEGKTALEAQDYQQAFGKLDAYMVQTNYEDSVIAYNCGVCADKIENHEAALKYFDIAVQKKYNLQNAYIGKMNALKSLNRNDEYLATLKEAVEAFPNNKGLVKAYANYYLKAGIAAQKAGKMDEAENAFKQVLTFQAGNKNALYSLGTLFFNKGATAAKSGKTDKAQAEFKESKGYLETLVKQLDASKSSDKKMLDNVNNLLAQIDKQLAQ